MKLAECVRADKHFEQLIFDVLLLKMPLYSNISGRTVVYWLSNIGVSRHLKGSYKSFELIIPCTEWRRPSHSQLDQ